MDLDISIPILSQGLQNNEIDEDELFVLTQPQTPKKNSRIPITARKRRPQSSPEKITDTIGQNSLFVQQKLAEIHHNTSADSAVYLQAALELLEKAVALENKQGKRTQIQQVTTHLQEVMNKQNATYGAKIDRLKAAVNSLVKIVKGKENTPSTFNFTSSTPTAKTSTTNTGLKASNWANTIQTGEAIGTTFQFPKQKAQQVKKPQEKKVEKNRRVILFKATTSMNSPIELRNLINKALGKQVIAAITTSNASNTIITTTEEFSAEYLILNKEKWEALIPHQNALIDTKWYKVLVHDVPLDVFSEENGGIKLLKEEIETFNKGLKLQNAKWLVPQNRRDTQKRSSAIIAFTSHEQANLAVQRKRLFFAGIEGRTEKFFENLSTLQCQNCQQFGHSKEVCRKPTQCGICSKEHLTQLHRCEICETIGKTCVHTKPICANCKEPHTANSQICVSRPNKPNKKPAENLPTEDNTQC